MDLTPSIWGLAIEVDIWVLDSLPRVGPSPSRSVHVHRKSRFWRRRQRSPVRARSSNPCDSQHGDLSRPRVSKRRTEDWLSELSEEGIPCGPILSIPEALTQARLVDHPHPNGVDTVRTVALPYGIGEAPRATSRPAPNLGGDRAQILAKWLGDS